MISFLSAVADSLLSHYGTNLSTLRVVFPNKRVSLFLNRELAAAAQRRGLGPVMAPSYLTISELFQHYAPGLAVVDNIEGVCQLYQVYKAKREQAHNPVETLDQFYGWGEVMLSDFNDIDKQMVDVRGLFKYVQDWKALETSPQDYLSPRQIEILKSFFSDFNPDNSEVKRSFIELWQCMEDIYHTYHDTLLAQGKLYDGALCRRVVEMQPSPVRDEGLDFAFVGFNILPPVQLALLKQIRAAVGTERARFYWDYDPKMPPTGLNRLFDDACHLSQEESQLDLTGNVRQFGNALPGGWSDQPAQQQFELVRTDTAHAQVHSASHWLEGKDLARTAVVLADETLLPQMMGVLPSADINITMGYPLTSTPVPGLVRALQELQTKGRRRAGGFYKLYLDRVRQHPFYAYMKDWGEETWAKECELSDEGVLTYLDETLQRLLRSMPFQSLHSSGAEEEVPPYVKLGEEAIFRVHDAILRLLSLHLGDLNLALRLLESIMRTLSIPLHGEPLCGLQVMGVLETRSIDFDNVVVLSAQDGILPKASSVNSLIPFCMRKPFGLSTEEQQVSVYAYNFFRLVRRAKNVRFLFSTGDRTSPEMSRFLRQMLAQDDIHMPDSSVAFAAEPHKAIQECFPDEVEKDTKVLQELEQFFNGEHYLSPSAIDNFLSCPMKFYYHDVRRYRVDDKITTSLAENQFGTVFHKTAEIFYQAVAHPETHVVEAAAINPEQCAGSISRAIDLAFKEEVFDKSDIKDFEGELVIARRAVEEYMHRLVVIDRLRAPFTLCENELKVVVPLTLPTQKRKVMIGGKIDRIDLVHNHPLSHAPALRIIDYKTGGRQGNKELGSGDLAKLFDSSADFSKRQHNIMQTLFYASVLPEGQYADKDVDVMPGLVYVADAADTAGYDERVVLGEAPLNRFQTIRATYESHLVALLDEHIFNPEEPFARTAKSSNCDHCDFRLLCGLTAKVEK